MKSDSDGSITVSDLLSPANIVVFAIVAVGLVVGIRRIVDGAVRGKSCCSDGNSATKSRKVVVTDTDASHYPYSEDLLIGGMSCENCAHNVENALNGIEGLWAHVDLDEKTAHVLSKQPIDIDTLDTAVRNAGYYVMRL